MKSRRLHQVLHNRPAQGDLVHHKFRLGWVPTGTIVPDSVSAIPRTPAGSGIDPAFRLSSPCVPVLLHV